MSQEYKIAWVGDQARTWNGKHGSFVDYKIALEGRDGTVSWTRKADSDTPTVGLVVFGSVIEEEIVPRNGGEPFTAYKFKAEQRDDGVPAIRNPSQSRVNAPRKSIASDNGNDDNYFDAKGARIERQSVQKAVGALLSGTKATQAEVKTWLDYLSEDLDAYEKVRRFASVKPEPTLEEAVLDESVPTEPAIGAADPEDPPF